MKTDLVLNMDEYLNTCCGVPRHVNPPADNARHIQVTGEDDVDPRNEEHDCQCDRWGHPCPDCKRKPGLCPAADELRL